MHKRVICAASRSLWGRGIANSYRNDPITLKILKTALKSATIPKSEGEYKRVIMGVVIIAMSWAIAVPVLIVKIPLHKGDAGMVERILLCIFDKTWLKIFR